MSRYASLLSPEILAILSALALVAIFVFAQVDRQAQGHDLRAQRLAQRVQKVMLAAPPEQETAASAENAVQAAAAPPVKLTAAYLTRLGLNIPPGFTVRFDPDRNVPTDWQVDVWHEEGVHVYQVTAEAIQEKLR